LEIRVRKVTGFIREKSQLDFDPTNRASIPASKGSGVSEQGGSLARKRYQTGNLYLKGESWVGRWRVDVVLSDGSQRRVRRARVIGTLKEYPTKRLARRRFETLLAEVNATDYRPRRIASLAEFVERWRTDVLSHHKAATVKAAESHLRSHILPHLGRLRLEEITSEAQQRFVTHLSARLKRKSVSNILSTLSAILRTAKKWDYRCVGVNFEALTLPERGERIEARFFTPEEARRILASTPEPYATAFEVAALTAMRPGELFGLKVTDLDFDRRTISIRRSARYSKLQAPKTNTSARVVPIPERLATRLRLYVNALPENSAGLLFATRKGTPLCANNVVQRYLWPVLDRLGIPRCGLKAFRHAHSSLLVETGAPMTVAQKQLGHKDARVTLGIYSHVIGDSQRRAVEKVAEVLDYGSPNQRASA
jgi:integrase